MEHYKKIIGYYELNHLLEIIHALVKCEEITQYKKIAHSFLSLTGANYMIFGFPEKLSNGKIYMRELNINYPQEWVSLYKCNEFWRIDPIVIASLQKSDPHHWTEIYRRLPPEKSFIDRACDFGLRDGYSCLVRSVSGFPWTIVSISDGIDFNLVSEKMGYLLEKMTPHFHIALLKLNTNDGKLHSFGLTQREVEVLKWLHQGKTSWEISVILKVSEATVNFHVKNLKLKLNVVNRSQAVAVAIHNGLITL